MNHFKLRKSEEKRQISDYFTYKNARITTDVKANAHLDSNYIAEITKIDIGESAKGSYLWTLEVCIDTVLMGVVW